MSIAMNTKHKVINKTAKKNFVIIFFMMLPPWCKYNLMLRNYYNRNKHNIQVVERIQNERIKIKWNTN